LHLWNCARVKCAAEDPTLKGYEAAVTYGVRRVVILNGLGDPYMSLHGSRSYATVAAATLAVIAALVGASAASAAPLAWSEPVRVHTQGAITDISCPTATFCAAADGAGKLLTSDPASATWPVTGTDTATPRSVSCGTPTFCVVVDSGWRAMSYSNGSWGPRVAPSGGSATSINAVSCTSASFCFSGSGYTTTPRTLDGGATWEIQNNQGVNYPGQINAVSCAPGADATTGFCVVVDSTNSAFVSSNGGLSFFPPHRPDGVIAGASGLTSVSCTSSTACVAVDSAGRAFYFRGGVLGGADWTAVDADLGRQLTSVSCVPGSPAGATFCAAVDSGGYQIESTDGGATWTTPSLITGTTGTAPLNAISCPTPDFCVATDNGGNAYTGAPQLAPANSGAAPTVANGPAQVGQDPALRCSDSGVVWTGPSPTVGHRWQTSVPSSGAWADVAGAGAQTYTPVPADAGNLLRCVTTATNSGGATDATSAATDPVLAAATPPPPIVGPPAPPPLPPVTDPPPVSPVTPLGAGQLLMSHRNTRANASGTLIGLRCVGSPAQRCQGTVKLETTQFRSRRQLGAARATTLTASYDLAAGESRNVRVQLPSASRTQLRKRGKTLVRAVATFNGATTLTRLMTVYPRRRASR
jgi:hypothetical protein